MAVAAISCHVCEVLVSALELRPELASNPDPRCPCALLLDASHSMASDGKVTALNRGLRRFRETLIEDPLAKRRVEVTSIVFGDEVRTVHDFVEARAMPSFEVHTNGATPMARAVLTALDLIDARKQQYDAAGVDYYRPWLFVLTDGEPTDDPALWRAATERLRRLDERRSVSVFAIGVEGADMDRLGELSSRRPPQRLAGLRFEELFEWLSRSLTAVSHSEPSGSGGSDVAQQQVPLPPTDPWAYD